MFVCEVMASEHNKIKTVLLRLIIRGVTKWLGWLLRTQWPKASHFCSFTRLKYKRVRVHWTSYCLAITACWARHERARTRRRRRLDRESRNGSCLLLLLLRFANSDRYSSSINFIRKYNDAKQSTWLRYTNFTLNMRQKGFT